MASLLERSAASEAASQLRAQWVSPSDIFSVLLIIGGDVIQRALAQISGRFVTPVTFSFGWVAYSVSALLSAVGDNKLMPASPDYPSIVINAKNGYVRANQSWILGRLLRDYEHWMPEGVKADLRRMLAERRAKQPDVKISRIGLCVSVFEATEEGNMRAGVPVNDWVWRSGLGVAFLQLGIAAIPLGLYGQWEIMVITACGILLAFATGAIPQWRAEKWACRDHSPKNVIITRGNGAQHAIVILGNKVGLDLEDLAAAEGVPLPSTRYFVFIFAALWIILLITAAGLRVNTWYILAVGSIGMVQNIIVAGASRDPSAFGIHLVHKQSFLERKVMATLKATEIAYPHVGRSLLETFFPGKLREDEEAWWREAQERSMSYDQEDEDDIDEVSKEETTNIEQVQSAGAKTAAARVDLR